MDYLRLEYEKLEQKIAEAKKLSVADPALAELAAEEIKGLEEQKVALEQQIKTIEAKKNGGGDNDEAGTNSLILELGYEKKKIIGEELFIYPKINVNIEKNNETEKYFHSIHIPENITHIKIDIGLGMWNIQSQDWLKKENDLFVFMSK